MPSKMMTRAIAAAAFEKKTFNKKNTGAITRSMTRAAFETRKKEKKVTFKDAEVFQEILEKRKNVKSSTILKFVNSSNMNDGLETVPGIGKVNKGLLNEDGVDTVSELVDMFFEFEGEDGVDGAYSKFELWLKDIGVNSYRDTISMCISAKWYVLAKTKGGKREH